MTTNKFYTLIFIGIITIGLLSCEKDKVTPVSYGNDALSTEESISGNFYCTVDYQQAYNGTTTENYDFVYKLEVTNDTIYFKNRKFPLSSYDLASGTGSHEYTINFALNATAKLTFSNNFNTIYFLEYWPQGVAPTSITIQGNRSELEETNAANHPFFTDQSGTYELDIIEKENWSGLDNNYTANVDVLYPNNGTITINGVQRDLGVFHSYRTLDQTINMQGTFEDYFLYVAWNSNQITYNNIVRSGTSYPPADSSWYYYTGSKL